MCVTFIWFVDVGIGDKVRSGRMVCVCVAWLFGDRMCPSIFGVVGVGHG